jgi:hypothetical protein
MPTMRKKDTSKGLWIANYPPLHAWLDALEARRLHQQRFGNDMIETWTVNGQVFVVLVHSNGNGWDIFTSAASSSVAVTLEDAEERLGIVTVVATP